MKSQGTARKCLWQEHVVNVCAPGPHWSIMHLVSPLHWKHECCEQPELFGFNRIASVL